MRRDFVAREITREIIVGAFMVMIFLGLGYFTIILSRESVFRKKTTIEVVFDNVMGLRETDLVVVRGMPVGKVSSLALEKDGVHVFVSLDKPLYMKKDYQITVVATSVLGGRHMSVEQGSDKLPVLPVRTVFRGDPPYDIMTDAAELVNSVKEQFMEGGIVDSLREASVQLKEISIRMNAGEGTLGRLFSDDDTLYENFLASAQSLRAIAERLEKGEGTLGKFMAADDGMYEDLKASTAALRSMAERVNNGEGMIGKLMSPDDALYDDLASSIASLRRVSDKIEKGEGAIGRLLQDDELYHELRAMIMELRATVDDFRETSPVTTFTSVFFGAF